MYVSVLADVLPREVLPLLSQMANEQEIAFPGLGKFLWIFEFCIVLTD